MARITASLADDPQSLPRDTVRPGDAIRILVEPDQAGEYVYEWRLPPGAATDADLSGPVAIMYFDQVAPGRHEVVVAIYRLEGETRTMVDEARLQLEVLRPAVRAAQAVDEGGLIAEKAPTVTQVALRRSAVPFTPDVALWMVIRRSAQALSFRAYDEAMQDLLCNVTSPTQEGLRRAQIARTELSNLAQRRYLPLNDTDAYRLLKIATEAYVLANVGIVLYSEQDGNKQLREFDGNEVREAAERLGLSRQEIPTNALQNYLRAVDTRNPKLASFQTLPYLALVRQKLRDAGIKSAVFIGNREEGLPEECYGILAERLMAPVLIELIWSYWHEEAMLVQTMNAISRRFQNVRGPGERDPLAHLELDPLRPLNNLLWGYVQDEQHRLSVLRRAYEYDHHYGISLLGKAVGALRPADSRSKFLEGFHNLLHLCTIFYQQDDDTTVIADGFPLLNALREVHLELSRGAHNQFGDLPSTARQEMLMQQWLLARPEFREFLPTRIMVTYPEAWMGPVDAMKQLQGWIDTSVVHFYYLAFYGEQILLGIRYGAWNDPDAQREWAANWARFWRNEIQGYIHAYRAVTGVDLSAETTERQPVGERYLQPAVHLSRQLERQRRGTLPAAAPIQPSPAPRRKLPGRQGEV
ncbi:MAG: hypothetical protein ACPL8I_10020 [Chloroflexaceae bacterium]